MNSIKQENATRIDPLAIRCRTGLSQSEFWATLGVTQSGGSRYENNRAMPRPVAMLLELHYIVGVDIVRLLKNGQAKHPDS